MIEDQIELAVNARFEKLREYLRGFPPPSDAMPVHEWYPSFAAHAIAEGLEWEEKK